MGREVKTVKIPVGKPRKQQAVLAKEAEAGWRLVEIVRGPVLRSWDVAHLERDSSDAPAVPKERSWFSAPAPAHEHVWTETTGPDDARNSTRVYECACGQVKTESA